MLQNRFHASIIWNMCFSHVGLSQLFRAATVRPGVDVRFLGAIPSWHSFKDLQVRHIWKCNICSFPSCFTPRPSSPPLTHPPNSGGGRRFLQRAPLFLITPLPSVFLLRPASFPCRPSPRIPREPRGSRQPAPGGGCPSLSRGPAPGEGVLEDVSARWVILPDNMKSKSKSREADRRASHGPIVRCVLYVQLNSGKYCMYTEDLISPTTIILQTLNYIVPWIYVVAIMRAESDLMNTLELQYSHQVHVKITLGWNF